VEITEIINVEYKVKCENGDFIYVSIIENNPQYGISITGAFGAYGYRYWAENNGIVQFMKNCNYDYFWGNVDSNNRGYAEPILNPNEEIKHLLKEVKRENIDIDDAREIYDFYNSIKEKTLREVINLPKPDYISDESLIYMDSDRLRLRGHEIMFKALQELFDYILGKTK
jgi:hypothetical protein